MAALQDTGLVPVSAITAKGIVRTDSGRTMRTTKTIKNPFIDGSKGTLFSDSTQFVQLPDSATLLPDTSAAPILMIKPFIRQTESIILYGNHELTVKHRGPISRPDISPGWLFPVLLVIVSVFTWLRLFYSRYFTQMLAAVFNTNLANQIVRDENILVQRATVYLSLMYYLIAALFLYVLSFRLNWELSVVGAGFGRFLFFTIVVSAVYAIKFMVLKFCGWLFDLDRELTVYLFNIFIINNVLGMLLFPFIVLMAYNPAVGGSWLMTISLLFIGLLYIFRLLRGLQIGLATPGFSLLYLFLYLCTLELAPMLVLLRMTGAVKG